MVTIPEPVARMVLHPETHKVLTTVDPEGKPHAIVCASLTMNGDDTVVAAEVFMYRTAENIAKNENVEILVWKGKNAYSLKAKAVARHTEGELFDKMCTTFDKFSMYVVAVWEFKVEEIWDESASKSAGEKVV